MHDLPQIELTEDSNDTHTRYVLVTEEAPALVNIHGLITQITDTVQGISAILLLTNNGATAPVQVEDDRGTYYVSLLGTDHLVEEIQYARDSEGDSRYMTHHEVFANGFTTDEVPLFAAA